jgi:putative hydrolase of the HAD superfamily
MITTVVFDLDDTLYSEVEYCNSGLRATAGFITQTQATGLDQEEVFSVLWDQFQQGNRSQTLNAALDTLGIPYDEKLIRSLVLVYRKHRPRIKLPQESRRVLDELADAYTLALLTDGFLPAQRLKVQALGIKKYFPHIVFTEQLGRQFWKPSPLGFQQLCQILSVPGLQMVYVGDNAAKDFIAPNSLGFTTIQIQRPDRIHDALPPHAQARADHILDNLGELPRLLESLNRIGLPTP